jgi:hypothetical protein
MISSWIGRIVPFVAVAGLTLGAPGTAEAGPLNPDDFPSLGAFPTASGTFTYDTNALTITGPGLTTPLQGTLSASGVAVFDFDSINLNANQAFFQVAIGSLAPPLAFLSRGNITIDGTININGISGITFAGLIGGSGGPGGYAGGGNDSIGGGPGGGGSSTMGGGSGTGGGFGGSGGYALFAPGGVTYGNLLQALQGGSGGGGGAAGLGGGGGGALEIGAVGNIFIDGSILANGGGGGGGRRGQGGGGGGGSGGGILIHGNSVTLTGSLSAQGGQGGGGPPYSTPGGGGGGGRVVIEYGGGGFLGNTANINVNGGPTGGVPIAAPGATGVISFVFVPEPASFIMLALGLAGVGIAARFRSR